MDLRIFREECDKAGLGKDWKELSLTAIKKRQLAIELGDVTQTYSNQSAELLEKARVRGLNCPDQLKSDDIANLLA